MNIKVDIPQASYITNAVEQYARGQNKHLIGFYNAENGDALDTMPIYEDFGDVAPFLSLMGRKDLADQEFESIYSKLTKTPMHTNLRRRKSYNISTYDWTDLILGLIDYSHLSQNKKSIEICDQMVNLWDKHFYADKKHYAKGKALKINEKVILPLPICTSLDVGMFPELLIRYAQMPHIQKDTAKKQILIRKAKHIVDSWLNSQFFRQYGLFPNIFTDNAKSDGVAGYLINNVLEKAFPNKTKTVTLFKHNTNALASVLLLWVETQEESYKNAIEQWVQGCKKHLLQENNTVAMMWNSDDGVTQSATDHNFQVIDLLCDIYEETKEGSYLELAADIADSWLSLRGKAGFFPHHTAENSKRRLHAMSDSQTDFSVALMKLWAQTKEDKYKIAAESTMHSIEKFMHKSCGLANWVDINTGEVINNTCKTKFMILSLKGWLAINNPEQIYKNTEFTSILSDR